MYRVIIFDFFGVFCPDVSHVWFEKHVPDHVEKLAKFDEICTESDYGRLSRDGFYREVGALTGIPTEEVGEGIDSEIRTNTDLLEYVQRLRDKGFKIACLSNGTHEWTLQVIDDYRFGHLFDRVFLSSDIGIVKPDAGIFEFVLNKLDVTPDEVIFVDDRQANISAAEALGIRSIIFTTTAEFIREFETINLIRARTQ